MATLLAHTVKPSGGDFTTLDAAIDHIVASHANLVTSDVYAEIVISGDWTGAPDTAAVAISGITTDATRYLKIYTDTANRAGLSLNTSKYILSVSNASCIAITTAKNVWIDGLQIVKAASNAHYQACVYFAAGITSGSSYWVSNCLMKQAGNNSYREPVVSFEDTDTVAYIWNCVAYGSGTVDHAANSAIYAAAGTSNVYSCTLLGGKYGLYAAGTGKTHTVKNTYAGGTATEDFYRASGTLVKVNCASEDQSADDTSGTDETATNCVAAAVAVNTDTFVNVTAGSQDFHLAADGLSPLMAVGVDTSGDSAPMNFTTNMEGETRDATWDIGPDSWYVAPATGMTNDIVMIFEC